MMHLMAFLLTPRTISLREDDIYWKPLVYTGMSGHLSRDYKVRWCLTTAQDVLNENI